MATVRHRYHCGDHFVLTTLERQFGRHQRAECAEGMKQRIRDERMGGDYTGCFAVIYGMNGGCVFDRIELALRFHRFLYTIVIVHSNGLDPGHSLPLLATEFLSEIIVIHPGAPVPEQCRGIPRVPRPVFPTAPVPVPGRYSGVRELPDARYYLPRAPAGRGR